MIGGMIKIKRYIVSLTENVTDQVITVLETFGAKIIWASETIPNLITIETEKPLEEVRGFYLVESADEEAVGRFV